MVVIGVAIVLEDGGPVIFGQVRLGRDGRPFRMWKLRSMVAGAEELLPDLLSRNEAEVPFFKLAGDPRTTWVGRRIRRIGIDELPQLVNVLRGEMSLVGPRPMLPAEHAAAPDLFADALSVRPGLTGPCQVRGISRISTAEHAQLDREYARSWNLLMDAALLGRTAAVVGRSVVDRQRLTR